MGVSLKIQKKIIISHLFDFDPNMTAFLFEPMDSLNLRAHPEVIVFDSWEFSSENQILIRAITTKQYTHNL